MQTGEDECLAALHEAADILGESPTRAAYEELGLTPASATIIRVVEGWNEAKERAGLATASSRGARTEPKPDTVDIPDDTTWEALSVDQRWHYRNRQWNTERTLQRRARLRLWVNERKQERGCRHCDATDHRVLEFHHTTPEDKRMAVGEMITHGYGKSNLREEMQKCIVLCSNCHRMEQYHHPAESGIETARDRTRAWLYDRKSASGCTTCGETDPRSLVFHHVGDEKSATIAEMVSTGQPKSEIQAEVECCEILCANCHRKEHYKPP